MWPSIGISGAAEYNNQANPLAGGSVEYHDFYATANLSWELDIWGKMRRQKESAMADLLAQEAYQQGIRISLIAGPFQPDRIPDEITWYNVQIRQSPLELNKYKLIARYSLRLVVAQAEAGTRAGGRSAGAGTGPLRSRRMASGCSWASSRDLFETGDSILYQINTDIIRRGDSFTADRPAPRASRQAEQQLISANAQVGVARAKMLSDPQSRPRGCRLRIR